LSDFKDTEFVNTDEKAMFSFGDPNPDWANPDDCGDFTCTGLYNVLVEMKNTAYSGPPNGLPANY